MKKIVLGGSRHLNLLPESVKERLNTWMEEEGAHFLIGDASGIDAVLQAHLHKCAYEEVTVYTSADAARTNIGSWHVEVVETSLKSPSAARHTIKDRRMTEIAEEGLMLWDQESVGTLANILHLQEQGKDVRVYDSVEDDLRTFYRGLDLHEYLEPHANVKKEAEKRLETYDNRKKREEKEKLQKEEPGLFSD